MVSKFASTCWKAASARSEGTIIPADVSDETVLPGQFVKNVGHYLEDHQDDMVTFVESVSVVIRFEVVDVGTANHGEFRGGAGPGDDLDYRGVAWQSDERIVVEDSQHSGLGQFNAGEQQLATQGTDKRIVDGIGCPIEFDGRGLL